MTLPEQSDLRGARANPPAQSTTRALVEFAVRGDLRFLSHHEEMRVLQRAMIRARWPLAFSQGFNPRPQAALCLPRNLGTASECELAAADLLEAPPAQQLFDQLAPVLPADMPLLRITAPAPRRTMLPLRAVYEVELDDDAARRTAPRVTDFLAQRRIVVQRDYGPLKPKRPADIRPYIETLILDAATLRIELSFEQQRSARASEILTELGLPAGDYEHRIRRCSVEWNIDPTANWSGSQIAEGKNFVQGTQEGRAQAGGQTPQEDR